MPVRLTRPALDQILAEAASAAPEECCGILLGHDGVIGEALPAMNVAIDRRRHFEIDPQALVDAHRAARGDGPDVIGYYHSHPAGPAEPSAVDRAMASADGKVWAIVGEGGVTFWCDDRDGFAPLPYVVEDR